MLGMEATANYPLALIPPPTPLSSLPCERCPLLREVLDLRGRAGYWETCYRKAKEREQRWQQEIDQLKAEKRSLEERLRGGKSEKRPGPDNGSGKTGSDKTSPPKRGRGQQATNPGPLRRKHEHLPVEDEVVDLPEDQRLCTCCGKPFAAMEQTDDGEILEVEVRAHRRRYRRKRYRPTCHCNVHPAVVSAPPPAKLIPKGHLGISIWVDVLLQKFVCFQPLQRVLRDLAMHGLDLSPATITDGLHKLVPLFQPLYQGLIDRHLAFDHWHGDETRWPVFERTPDKANSYWTLSVYGCSQVIVFVLDPTRCHDVPENYFGDARGIFNVDRTTTYKAMWQVKEGRILLAFCWSHVRRDFLLILTSWQTTLETWALTWLERIGKLFELNHARVEVRDDATRFAAADQRVREQVAAIAQQRDSELQQPDLHSACRKALTSLSKHWSGLTLFVDHPEVPMDNNVSERCHRGPVVCRKNFYGSGSVWSGRLACMLFSLFQTLALWDLCPRRWLTAYLTACAEAGGQVPPNWQSFLPWRMTREQYHAWADPTAPPKKEATIHPPPSESDTPK
jgi:transposase